MASNPKDTTQYIWVRWRRNTSASHGTWVWEEFTFPADLKTKKKLNLYFKSNHVSWLTDREDFWSEHFRGIEWEFVPIPKNILQKKLEEALDAYMRAGKRCVRIEKQIRTAPAQENIPIPKKVCRDWPACGCLRQFKTPDCRPPYTSPLLQK